MEKDIEAHLHTLDSKVKHLEEDVDKLLVWVSELQKQIDNLDNKSYVSSVVIGG